MPGLLATPERNVNDLLFDDILNPDGPVAADSPRNNLLRYNKVGLHGRSSLLQLRDALEQQGHEARLFKSTGCNHEFQNPIADDYVVLVEMGSAFVFKKLCDVLTELGIQSLNFEFFEQGVKILSCQHDTLVDVFLRKSAFLLYELKYKNVVGVDLGMLKQVVKVAKADDFFRLYTRSEDEYIYIELYSKNPMLKKTKKLYKWKKMQVEPLQEAMEMAQKGAKLLQVQKLPTVIMDTYRLQELTSAYMRSQESIATIKILKNDCVLFSGQAEIDDQVNVPSMTQQDSQAADSVSVGGDAVEQKTLEMRTEIRVDEKLKEVQPGDQVRKRWGLEFVDLEKTYWREDGGDNLIMLEDNDNDDERQDNRRVILNVDQKMIGWARTFYLKGISTFARHASSLGERCNMFFGLEENVDTMGSGGGSSSSSSGSSSSVNFQDSQAPLTQASGTMPICWLVGQFCCAPTFRIDSV